jgi:F0F1-type ATP synthase assembly protein I
VGTGRIGEPAEREPWRRVGRRPPLINDKEMSADDPSPKKSTADTFRTLGALSTVGISFVLAIVIGAWAGWALDRWLGTSPWFFFLFFVFGLVAGVTNVYRTAGKFLK